MVCLEIVAPMADETGLMLCSICFFWHQIPVLMWHCNLGVTCDVTSFHVIIILESLPKPGDDILGDSKFLGYFQLGTPIFQAADNSTKKKNHPNASFGS
ncbi:uncharacterized protein TNCV_1730591 [Trichonephila clavipes]|nr:uncharacterized protein TNCV_1730591 [Trichonephila clavipes]